jgi:hypothetical protein
MSSGQGTGALRVFRRVANDWSGPMLNADRVLVVAGACWFWKSEGKPKVGVNCWKEVGEGGAVCWNP